jgi:uncharacterized protein with ATP-grasp and redox domains
VISYLDCYPCLVRHALEASREITADPAKQREVLVRVLRLLPEIAEDTTPVRIAAEVHSLIREALGVDDPYLAQKKKYNELAQSLVPELKKTIARAKNPLEAAVRIAIAGNIIDFGALGERFDLKAMVKECRDTPLGLNDLPQLEQDLKRAKRIVYVGDNAGEIVFDRLLVEEIQRLYNPEIFFVVRGRPILNDATLEDARSVGLTDRVTVVASGGDGPGCELDRSPALKPLFEAAELVIAKGQGNYEALSSEPYPIYFLLRIKCRVIARDIGGPRGTAAVKRSAKD